MTECPTCWGTGRFKGWGGPCPEGCAKPSPAVGINRLLSSATTVSRCNLQNVRRWEIEGVYCSGIAYSAAVGVALFHAYEKQGKEVLCLKIVDEKPNCFYLEGPQSHFKAIEKTASDMQALLRHWCAHVLPRPPIEVREVADFLTIFLREVDF